MRLLHISDLHVCVPHLQPLISDAFSALSEKLKQDFAVEFSYEEELRPIKRAVRELDPDAICITGDITTFGDVASFTYAASFVKDLRLRRDGSNRPIIVTPGNHDVLCGQLKQLLTRKGFIAKSLRWTLLREEARLFNHLLRNADVQPDAKQPLSRFSAFVREAEASQSSLKIGELSGKPVWCIPFESVSLDPLWVNIGVTAAQEFENFRDRLREKGVEDSILIALLHHNPISSPEVIEPKLINAYNSMPGASLFLREMQNAGVDLVLYGHQHMMSSCLIDYSPEERGHVYLIGAASATTGSPRGFNVLEISTRYNGQFCSIPINPAGGFSLPSPGAGEWRQLVFDSDRPSDTVTICTQKEVRHFRYAEADSSPEWERMYDSGAEDFLIIGPRLSSLVDKRLDVLLARLKDPRTKTLRILMSDPALFKRIERLQDADIQFLNELWGEEHTWKLQSETAQVSLDRLRRLRTSLSPLESPKLLIRLSHTLLPIGSIARDLDHLDGAMLIRLLPVGRMGSLSRPVIRLRRRHDEAMYAFYRDYLNALWARGADS